MSGMWGNNIKISIFGESHGNAIGINIDGLPSGFSIDMDKVMVEMARRAPGKSPLSTPRKEGDVPEILSGYFEGKTTGTPLSMIVWNKDQQSQDYDDIASYYRPGHADYTFDGKFGFRDYRGGGRSSGRETIGRVAGGAVANEILKQLGINVRAYTKSIGDITINYGNCQTRNIVKSPFSMPDLEASAAVEELVKLKKEEQDSLGGVIECIISGMPIGIGEPVFEKLDANLSRGILSIGAIKGIEFGSGFDAARRTGSVNNDPFIADEEGKITKVSNSAGGVLGGMSDGSEIIFRAAVKPTSSIGQTQKTVNKSGQNIEINIQGRHDPLIVPRAVVVVESMAGITLVDMLFMNMSSKMDKVIKHYK